MLSKEEREQRRLRNAAIQAAKESGIQVPVAEPAKVAEEAPAVEIPAESQEEAVEENQVSEPEAQEEKPFSFLVSEEPAD